jgi:signal transduction histidine kinase
MASHIYDSGKRLMKTLDSIMMLSQLESGFMQLHFDYLNLHQLLQQITERYIKQAGDKGLAIELIKTRPILGYIDKYFFSQAFSHVLENAIKFTNQGGVEIEAKTCTVKKTRHLLITITDSGIGISKANQKLIFEEFRQASEGYTRNYEGSGLGLTIAGKLIQHLGGKVEVESTLGAGSVFRITIPFPNKPVDNYPD